MKKYVKPVSEVMSLGLGGEHLCDLVVSESAAVSLPSDGKIDGGDALVKEERGSWDTGGLWD